jgi:hypothetical protein
MVLLLGKLLYTSKQMKHFASDCCVPHRLFKNFILVKIVIYSTVIFSRFISISESLPESGNIKMVEIWMLFSLFLPFLEVVLQSYVNYLRRKEDEDNDALEAAKDLKKPHVIQRTGFWDMTPDNRYRLHSNPHITDNQLIQKSFL